jgi:DNA-binding winged helix-turn-helix (wHTH) protein
VQDTFRIGDAYQIEPSLNRVTGPNGIIRLEPKVMLVLVCLAARAGQMVPKERLLHAAWADTAVGDDVLTRAISELRRLFDDDAKQPRVIETIPKAGYRLIAPVERPATGRVRAQCSCQRRWRGQSRVDRNALLGCRDRRDRRLVFPASE